MRTEYTAHIDRKKDEYSIQFETVHYEYFKIVEKACQKAVSKKDKAVSKERCSEARVLMCLCLHILYHNRPCRSLRVLRPISG